ncbi:MAG: glycosyltransferase family 4 protein [Candidatus Thorarchaeota archaeon]
MKILIVLHKLKKEGGMVLQHLKMSQQFKKMGCTVKIFSFDDHFNSHNIFFNYLLVYKKIRKIIKTFDPTIILTSDPYFSTLISLLAKKKSIPVVLRVGAVFHPFYAARIIEKISKKAMYTDLFYFFNYIFKQFDKLILKKSNFIIFNSYFLSKYYNKFTPHSTVINNGVDKVTQKKPEINHLLELVYVGRIEPRKSIEVILNSLIIAKKSGIKFHFSLIGDTLLFPDYWLKLENIIKCNNLIDDITIYGKIPNNKILSVLETKDILLFSTDERNFPITEGLPNVILEGMAAGLAIISTSVAGIPEIINNKNGLLVDSNPIDFAKAIIYFDNNKNSLLEIKEENIKLIKDKYLIERTSKQYLDIFQKIKKRN